MTISSISTLTNDFQALTAFPLVDVMAALPMDASTAVQTTVTETLQALFSGSKADVRVFLCYPCEKPRVQTLADWTGLDEYQGRDRDASQRIILQNLVDRITIEAAA